MNLSGIDTAEASRKSRSELLLEQVLLLPIVVTLLVATALVCGARCAAWQWWLGLAAVMAYPFFRTGWKQALVASLGFALFVFGVWLLTGVTVTTTLWDNHVYHFPAIRMLMLGWNPVWEGTAEAIGATYAQTEGFRIWHVLSMPRAVWYFSAAAAFFTNNQFNLYHPPVLFMLAGTIGYIWKALTNVSRILRLAVALGIVAFCQEYYSAVDIVGSLAALGLFACFYSYLKYHRLTILPIIIFTFWIASSKQLGVPLAAISWAGFVAVVLYLEREQWKGELLRVAKIALPAAALILIANISPYITNWVNYSHPLYPRYTANEEKYPTKNFTSDFLNLNDDAKAMMNRLAMFTNAYISPELTRDYYAWKLDKPDFRARGGMPWRTKAGHPEGYDSPLNAHFRLMFLIPIIVLLLFGGLAERFVAVVMLLCTIAVPVEMIGYLRYARWTPYAAIFCLPMVWEGLSRKKVAKYAALTLACLYGADRFCVAARNELQLVDDRLVISESIREGLPEAVYYDKREKKQPAEAALDMLKKLTPSLANVEIKTVPDEIYAKKDKALLNKEYPVFPSSSFRVARGYNFKKHSWLKQYQAKNPKPRGNLAQSLYELRMFGAFAADALLRALGRQLIGRLDK